MDLETQIIELKQQLRRIEKKQDDLLKPRPKWVTAHVITELTHWTNQQMRTHRNNGTVSSKKEGGKFLYDLNSLHQFLIKEAS